MIVIELLDFARYKRIEWCDRCEEQEGRAPRMATAHCDGTEKYEGGLVKLG